MNNISRRQFLGWVCGGVFATILDLVFGRTTDTSNQSPFESEFQRCKNDILYFVDHYLHLSNPINGQNIVLSADQREYLRRATTDDLLLVRKQRQVGMSTAAMVLAYWRTYFFENQHVLFLTCGDRMTKHMVDMFHGFFGLGERMCKGSRVEYANGSSIVFMSHLDNVGARGMKSPTMVIFDECAFWHRDDEGVVACICPSLDQGQNLIYQSTATKGTKWSKKFDKMCAMFPSKTITIGEA